MDFTPALVRFAVCALATCGAVATGPVPHASAQVVAVAAAPAAGSAPITEWSAETRTVLSFRVPDAALQRLLPAGWTVNPSTAPATAGANLNVTVMERTLVLDAKGAPVGTGTIRYVVFGASARNAATGQAGTLVVGGISPDAPGAYDVYVPATTSRVERTTSSAGGQAGTATEHWEFAAASGERIDVQLSYRRAPGVRSRAETVVRSARHPDFRRTYRIEQTSDVIRSVTTPDRIDRIEIKAGGPTIGPLFDGTEKLVSVAIVPHYVREISVP